MDFATILQAITNGIMVGGIYALVGMSLTIIFGVMKIINFCQGEIVMLGMYVSYICFDRLGLGPFASIPIVAAVMFLFGVLFQSTIITRSVRDGEDDSNVLFLTAGFGILFTNIMLLVFGSDYKTTKSAFSDQVIQLGNMSISLTKLISFFILCVLAVLLFMFLRYTTLGKQIRATSQNRTGAQVCGIKAKVIYASTYGIGAAIAGVAGACLMSFYYVFPSVGATYGTRAFIVVTIGGLGNILGAFTGGLVLGCLETVGAVVVGSALKDTLVYVCFILILVVKQKIQAKRRA